MADKTDKTNKSLIKKPLITEKGTDLGRMGKYFFSVDKNANKPEIKKAVEAAYKVKVISVNIVNLKPKKRRLGKTAGKKPGYKKAIVTLAKGQKIEAEN